MNSSERTGTDAADIVIRERARLREEERGELTSISQPLQLETVSNLEHNEVNESELDRRHRYLSQKLEQKQLEVEEQRQKLANMRRELKALEQPLKAEIMELRQHLEVSNRKEMALVTCVNGLRKELHAKEGDLDAVRQEKQRISDGLIQVMADYERRKTERLNEIAELVGGESSKPNGMVSHFAGF